MSPVTAAAIIVFCEGLVLWAVFPITNFYCNELGGGPVAVGVIFALLSGPKVIFNPIFGRLSDRLGRRPLIALASAGSLVGSVGWALAPNVAWLAVSRAVAGVFGAQAGLSAAIVADTTTAERRASGMGVLGAAFGLSMVVGPLLGGWVTKLGSHAAVGWMGATVQVVSILTALAFLPKAAGARSTPGVEDSAASAAQKPPGAAAVTQRRDVLLLMAVVLFMTLGFTQVTTTFSMLAKDSYGFTETDAGHAFAFFGLLGTIGQGGLVRVLVPRMGDRRVAMLGLLCQAVGTAVVATGPSTSGLWASFGVIGLGMALSSPTATALISHAGPPESQGTLFGFQQSVTGVGRGLGSFVSGFAYQHLDPAAPFVLSAVVGLLAAGLLMPLKRNGRGSRDT